MCCLDDQSQSVFISLPLFLLSLSLRKILEGAGDNERDGVGLGDIYLINGVCARALLDGRKEVARGRALHAMMHEIASEEE